MAGYRKLVLTFSIVALGAAVDIFSKNGLSSNLRDLLAIAAVGFHAGNVGEHIAGVFSGKPSQDSLTSAGPSDLPSTLQPPSDAEGVSSTEAAPSAPGSAEAPTPSAPAQAEPSLQDVIAAINDLHSGQQALANRLAVTTQGLDTTQKSVQALANRMASNN